MTPYVFSLSGTGISENVQGAAGFFRYLESTSGATPKIRIVTDAGDSFPMSPGDSVRVSRDAESFRIESIAGAIDGTVLFGKREEAADSSSTQTAITGTANVNLAIGAGQNDQTESSVTTARSNVYGGGTTRRRCLFMALPSNTDDIILGGAAVTTSNYAIRIAPGESWEDWVGGSASFFALSISGTQKLRCTYLT